MVYKITSKSNELIKSIVKIKNDNNSNYFLVDGFHLFEIALLTNCVEKIFTNKLISNIANITTNCYIIEDEKTKETMVIDPAGECDKIIELLDALGAKLKYIYLTHCHGDHIGAVEELKNTKGGKILIHTEDYEGLKSSSVNLTGIMCVKPISIEADSRVNDGDLLHIGELEFKVIHTPGHTKGGSSLYCEKEQMLFSGDTLFKGMWGRTDLPTSSFDDIIASISNKLLVLPDETIVYPGHGIPTRIVEEEPIYYGLTSGEE